MESSSPSRLHRSVVFVALGAFATACAGSRVTPPRSPASAPPPVFDALQEYRRSERLVAAPPTEPPIPTAPPLEPIPAPALPAAPICATGTAMVYVVTHEGVVHAFDPDRLTFRKVGTPSCSHLSAKATGSMAVDHSGNAWVRSGDGDLSKTHVSDLRCADSGVRTTSLGTGSFGMAFARTEHDAVASEQLFLSVSRPARLARVEGSTVVSVGRFPRGLADANIELSSLPDGRLFAFFTGLPATLAEIDPSDGSVRSKRPLSKIRLPHGDASFAFAAVRSEFFLFWSVGESDSTVTRLDANGELEHVVKNARMRIVGAGVPTCIAKPSSVDAPVSAELNL